MSYNIDKLLEKSVNVDDLDETVNVDSSNLSCSEYDDQSDDDTSISPPYIRKYDRRHKSHVPEDLRLRVNCRERERMHDLNSALDSLRQTLPYTHGPSVKKISKMSTLVLARNYIVMLNNSLEEMRKLVTDMSRKHASKTSIPAPPTPRAISPERLSAVPVSTFSPHSLPFRANQTPLHPVIPADIHKHFSAFPHVQSLYLPYRVSPIHQTTSGHANISPLCPCNFCQVSIATLPKPEWKQTC